MTNIPKIIHYCWFGGGKRDALTEKCIASWKTYCPDFEIVEWNESNYDVQAMPYVREAYRYKKWAFVTDYVRLDVVYEHGGIYLDCDVELIKPIDELLQYDAFFGFENGGNINTGVGFGAKKGNQLVWALLRDYQNLPFVLENGELDETPCPVRNTVTLQKLGLQKNNKLQVMEQAIFLPTNYLCPVDFVTGQCTITEQTLAIHHYNGSWLHKKQKNKRLLYKLFVKIFGEKMSARMKSSVRKI